MGLFDAITGSVIMKYKVETDAAKAKIKELSGEQKKAAKEAAEALEKQGKAAESMASQYAKGAAIIAGAYVLARDGVKQMREESRLSAGAAGVDIDALSDSWDGLKTRMDLLTLAQAGHRGAWKLTTAQIQQVSEGMRALEKQGFESGEVFDKFTAIMRKGKLEGLDDFGLSLKSTGDQTKDLQILLNALRGEARKVGGDFAMAGDDVVRATVKMEDGINRVRVMLGQATNAAIEFVGSLGAQFGREIFGSLPEDNGPGGAASAYAAKFGRRGAPRIGGGKTASGTLIRGAGGVVNNFADDIGPLGGWTSSLASADTYLFGGPDAAAQKAGASLAKFSGEVRQAMQGRGPLATASPTEFAQMIVGLPEGWRAVDEELGKRVDELSASLAWRLVKGMGGATEKAGGSTARGRAGRGGGGKSADLGPGLIFGAARSAFGALSAVADYEGAQNDNAAARAREDEILQQRFAATMEQNRRFAAEMAQQEAAMARDKEQTFLERTFGKVEEFDQYAAAFDTLKGAVTSGFNAWITGAESVGTAVRRSIAQSLGGYAIEMAGMALVAGATGFWHLATGNPLAAGELAAAAKYTAAAVALGGLAKLASPAGNGAPSTGGSATGGRAGRNQDHRGSGGGEWRPAGQQTVIILGSDYGTNSQRVRERNAHDAFSRTSTVYQPPRGAAA